MKKKKQYTTELEKRKEWRAKDQLKFLTLNRFGHFGDNMLGLQ